MGLQYGNLWMNGLANSFSVGSLRLVKSTRPMMTDSGKKHQAHDDVGAADLQV
ncbi:MAG: hypothetical protein ACI9CF_001792 [Candidatus Omnitrophota bacterium]|jgi:hypothetical protein